MSAPLAKGIVITVSVLVAAGIAVYESPQLQEWLRSSRRKIALTLNNWGDELTSHVSQRRDDISMTEELGEQAELRRRKVREDIQRRRELLSSCKRHRAPITSSSNFDALVDSEGRLKPSVEDDKISDSESKSTGVEITAAEPTSRFLNRSCDFAPSISNVGSTVNPEQHRELFEEISRNRLLIPALSETTSNHPSESLVDLTPTSEFSESELSFSLHSQPEIIQDTPSDHLPVASPTASSHTEEGFYYAHPDHLTGDFAGPARSAPTGFSENVWAHEVSSTPSIASSLSHIQNEAFDTTSDGTLSDLGRDRDNLYTPVSWSEVGSVVSSNDEGSQ
ncbi:hypothetical protein D8B26_005958 [Coccidioides posadasii str. Silveira]|uniref:Uncharacterized protein n=1 Tax=Coccidioides posadasii (strain RMSCC 757 / Silveira) TaxID=443226 RepID=E9DI67_COCPS|nr:conserved hypothetical protein [Coccidioides posadasii str. Silveira]QVM11305.1 hypothetical protein D8B26_005958 [Coccidioides posadasii str. Silveira]